MESIGVITFDRLAVMHAESAVFPAKEFARQFLSKKIVDSAVPMSLLELHPNVRFSFYRGGIGSCDVDMH